jgi:protein O-mannosyl-transferase
MMAAPQVVKPHAQSGIKLTGWARLTTTRVLSAVNKSMILWVLAITLIAFIGSLHYDFVYDDVEQIVGNRYVHSWHFLPRFFTEHVWGHLNPNSPGTYYRPVFLLWLLLNHSVFGLQASGWHFTSIALHVLVTYTVYRLALRINLDRFTAYVAALLFGLHPVHVEAVAWVSGVTEPLLAALFVPAFLCYLKAHAHERPARRWLTLSLLLYGLALLAKETAIVLPLMIFAYEWIFGESLAVAATLSKWRAPIRTAFFSAAPYFALSVIYFIVRSIVLNGIGVSLTPMPFLTMVLTWPSVLWFYIKLLIFPVGLSVLYDTPYVTSLSLSSFFLPLSGIVAATGLLWWASRRSRAIRFAAVWLILPILPVLKLSAFYWGEIAHDRYLYLPSIGFSIMLAIALRQIRIGRAKLFGQPLIQVVLILTVASLLRQATAYQNPYWANSIALYTRGVQIAPKNLLAKSNLGTALSRLGRYDEAIKLHRESLNLNPDYWLATYNLGYCYFRLGKQELAEQYLLRAIEINPTEPRQFLGLGLNRMEMGRLQEAAVAIRHAIELKPEASTYHYELGALLKKQGDLAGALNEFKAELKADPKNQEAIEQIAEIEERLHGINDKLPAASGNGNSTGVSK